MRKVTVEQWCDALESGEFKKAQGVLKKVNKKGDEFYCCLGVLACLKGDKFVVNTWGQHIPKKTSNGGSGSFLSNDVIGLVPQGVLATLNDGDKTMGKRAKPFKEIAKEIRKSYPAGTKF